MNIIAVKLWVVVLKLLLPFSKDRCHLLLSIKFPFYVRTESGVFSSLPQTSNFRDRQRLLKMVEQRRLLRVDEFYS